MASDYFDRYVEAAQERNRVAARVAELEAERDALKAQVWQQANELVRWRHGVQIEGDYVCEHALDADRLRTENARLAKVLETAKRVVSRSMHRRAPDRDTFLANDVEILEKLANVIDAALADGKEGK